MIFDASNKEHMNELRAVLKERGLFPKHTVTCTEIKNALQGMEISDLGSTVDEMLRKTGSDSMPAPVPAPVAPETIPVVAPTQKLAFRGFSNGGVSSSFLMLIHGAPGTGKTSLLAKAKRVIIGDVEKGSLKMNCPRVIIENWEHALEFVKVFFSEGNKDFDVMGIDTINALEKMCHEYVCIKNNWTSLAKTPFNRGPETANLEMTKFIQSIRNSSMATGKSVIFIGHSKVRYCPNPDGDDYERHCVGLHKELTEWVYGQMDHVLFAHTKMVMKTLDEDDKDSKVIAIGQNILQLNTGGTPNVISKNRCYPPLPKIIPMLPLNATPDSIEKFWKQF